MSEQRSYISENESEVMSHIGTLAHQIWNKTLKNMPDTQRVLLLGIQQGGVYLAEQIARIISDRYGKVVPQGTIDVTEERDDYRTCMKEAHDTDIPGESRGLDGSHVILVDEIMKTGRTALAALHTLSRMGRPAMVELAVLHTHYQCDEVPIVPSYQLQSLCGFDDVMLKLERTEKGARLVGYITE